MSMTSYIQRAIYKALVHDSLFLPIRVRLYFDTESNNFFTEEEYSTIKGNVKEKKVVTPPEGAMFCDSDKCEMPTIIGLPPKE